jgi:hypothetical protein
VHGSAAAAAAAAAASMHVCSAWQHHVGLGTTGCTAAAAGSTLGPPAGIACTTCIAGIACTFSLEGTAPLVDVSIA